MYVIGLNWAVSRGERLLVDLSSQTSKMFRFVVYFTGQPYLITVYQAYLRSALIIPSFRRNYTAWPNELDWVYYKLIM